MMGFCEKHWQCAINAFLFIFKGAVLRYADPVIFCVVYALSFALMGEVVKSVDPLTSSFLTYGIAWLFFAAINLKSTARILKGFKSNPKLSFYLNLATLVNMLLGFVVMQYVSALSYVIVFFGCLPFMKYCADSHCRQKSSKREGVLNAFILLSALWVSYWVEEQMHPAVLGAWFLTLFSGAFAAFYMQKSAEFHDKTGLSASQILSLRFFLLLLVTGIYAVWAQTLVRLSIQDVVMLITTAITGSIIPLFLMQRSILILGAKTTAQIMTTLPILCILFLWLLGFPLIFRGRAVKVFHLLKYKNGVPVYA